MKYKILLAIFGCVFFCYTVLAEPASFKELETKVYDVQQLTKIGSDYSTFSQHVTELGLLLGRYKREAASSQPNDYQSLIVEAGQHYLEALDGWRGSLSTSDELIRNFKLKVRYVELRDAESAMLKAETIKKSQ